MASDLADKADSYVCGISDTPLLGDTIGRSLDHAVRRWGDREALVSPSHGVRWTWKEFAEQVDALAAGLLALGLERGERIGIWSLNRPEWTLTQFAAAKAGLILVTINPAYRLSELEFALKKVGCAAIVTATAFKTSNYMEMLNTLLPELAGTRPGQLQAARLPALRMVIQIGGPAASGTIPFEDVARMGRAEHREQLAALGAALQFDDPVNIQFTSGTTGSPKGVTLTHHNILNNGYFTGRAMRLTEHDRICIPVPLYHCFGMVMGNLASVTLGTTMVYPGEGFDPLATLRAVEQEKCTALYGVPTMFIAELDHSEFKNFNLKSLRTGIMAGAPCPIEVMKRVNTEMNMREVTIAYGMTETSPVSFQSATDDPLERRVSTVGRIHSHVEVKVVDLEGRIVKRGERGELCTRGYSVMLGYWEEEGKDVRRARRQWLDAHRRPRHHRRRRLLQHRRPHQGSGDPRRREPLPARDRGVSVPSPQDPGRADLRRRRHPLRRGALRLDPRQAGRNADGRGGPCLLRRPDRPQQDPALRGIRRRVSDDRDGQDPEIRNAGCGGATAGIEGGEDGVRD
ncbi:hypothetical protein SG09_08390 [Bradyrhizobium ottawaense]|nr:hypothetical protein SG09_08390 [Bradyrhizobium ottawaense]